MLSTTRYLPVGALTVAASLFAVGGAHAAPAPAPAGSIVSGCGVQQTAQAFRPWNDPSQYFLAPDGDFAAAGASSWSTTGAAAVVPGGDGNSLAGAPASTQAMSLPDGSSATSAAICAAANQPSARLFAVNTGSSSSRLRVDATVSNGLSTTTMTVADLSAGPSWSPTPVIPLLENLLAVPGTTSSITLSFTPVGQGGHWQIDDLYVDPLGRGF